MTNVRTVLSLHYQFNFISFIKLCLDRGNENGRSGQQSSKTGDSEKGVHSNSSIGSGEELKNRDSAQDIDLDTTNKNQHGEQAIRTCRHA